MSAAFPAEQPMPAADSDSGARATARASLLFALTFVVIPNFAFLLASMWFVPERIIVAPFYLAVGLLAAFIPVWLTGLLLAGVAVFDAFVLVSRIFFLSPDLAVESIRFMVELDLSASFLYIAVVLTLVATVILMIWMTARYRREFRRARLVPAVVALAALIGIDGAINHTLAMFVPQVRAAPQFESGLQLSGIADGPAGRGERNLLLVLVEGFGAFADPAHRAMFDDALFTPEVRSRFTVSGGTSAYVGSTTNAESRELCGRWGDFRDYLEGGPFDCLPNRLRAQGVETISVHAFSADMFARDVWHPNIGFDRVIAGEALAADHADRLPSRCGLTFRSFCDPEVGRIVHELATEPVDRPRMIYWLTLNTHVPPEPAKAPTHLDCTDGGPFGDESVCDLAEMWLQVFDVVQAIASDPRLPPTDILVVGDHNTPLFRRAGRNLFVRDHVGWWALKSRADAERPTAMAPQAAAAIR